MVNIKRLTPTGQAVHFAPTHPGSDTFLYEVGLQLCDAANNCQEQSAHRAVSGDVLASRYEFDSETVEFIHNRQKMPRASRHAVEGGNNDDSESPQIGRASRRER